MVSGPHWWSAWALRRRSGPLVRLSICSRCRAMAARFRCCSAKPVDWRWPVPICSGSRQGSMPTGSAWCFFTAVAPRKCSCSSTLGNSDSDDQAELSAMKVAASGVEISQSRHLSDQELTTLSRFSKKIKIDP